MPAKLKIGLTGAMGAGKSEAAKALSILGVRVYDADILGHYALAKIESTKSAVCKLLGAEILNENSEIDRAKVAAKIFADAELLKKYEAIIHPSIRELWNKPLDYSEYLSFIAAQKSTSANYARAHANTECGAGKSAEDALATTKAQYPFFAPLIEEISKKLRTGSVKIIAVEAALLFEKKLENDFDFCLDVFCSKSLRLKRLSLRGMSLSEISARDAFQLPPENKAALSNAVLFNESDKSFLIIQAALCLLRLI